MYDRTAMPSTVDAMERSATRTGPNSVTGDGPTPIEGGIIRARDLCRSLDCTIDELEKRLYPILKDTPNAPGAPMPAVESEASPMAKAIADIGDGIAVTDIRLRQLINRLQC